MDTLEQLFTLEKQTPNNDTLLSQIAFYYLSNPDGDKELEYFKKAYQINPSIKNTHNYAFWAYYEYGEDELALGLFKKLIAQNPKSFYPYMVYANLLFTPSDYSDTAKAQAVKQNASLAIELYQKAITLFDNAPQAYQNSHQHELAYLYNNLANLYAVQKKFSDADSYYNQAIHLFSTIAQDNQTHLHHDTLNEYLYLTTLNKVRLKILVDDIATAQIFLAIAKQNPNACDYDIAHLYAIIGDNQACYDIIKGKEIDLSWDWIWQAIYAIKPSDYDKQIDRQIQQEIIWLNEYKADLAGCQELSEQEELKDCIINSEQALADLKYKQNTPPIPQLSVKEQCLVDLHYFSKCWLFDCKHCGNLVDDA